MVTITPHEVERATELAEAFSRINGVTHFCQGAECVHEFEQFDTVIVPVHTRDYGEWAFDYVDPDHGVSVACAFCPDCAEDVESEATVETMATQPEEFENFWMGVRQHSHEEEECLSFHL